jgi:hypothetical protein
MPIVMRARIPGMMQDQYDKMAAPLLDKIKTAKGFIAHAGCAIPGGWEVTEIWESPEDHDVWMKNTVMPAAAANGMNPPIVEIAHARRVELKK